MDSTRDVVGSGLERWREKKMTDVSTSESIALKSSEHSVILDGIAKHDKYEDRDAFKRLEF